MVLPEFELVEILIIAVSAAIILQVVSAVYLISAMRRASYQRSELNRQTFGLLRKVEGLVARKQEKILDEYDRMLERLIIQLPSTIAEKAGSAIHETERQILTRLAELEPQLEGDDVALTKMNELIRSMERLEMAMVRAATTSVETVLLESRKSLFSETKDTLAA